MYDHVNARFVTLDEIAKREKAPAIARNPEIRKMYYRIKEIARQESTRLYRLRWRMIKHGVSAELCEECLQEARELQNPRPDYILGDFANYKFAFR